MNNAILFVIGFIAGFIVACTVLAYKVKHRPDGILQIDTSKTTKDIYRFVLTTSNLPEKSFAMFKIEKTVGLKEIAKRAASFMDT